MKLILIGLFVSFCVGFLVGSFYCANQWVPVSSYQVHNHTLYRVAAAKIDEAAIIVKGPYYLNAEVCRVRAGDLNIRYSSIVFLCQQDQGLEDWK